MILSLKYSRPFIFWLWILTIVFKISHFNFELIAMLVWFINSLIAFNQEWYIVLAKVLIYDVFEPLFDPHWGHKNLFSPNSVVGWVWKLQFLN